MPSPGTDALDPEFRAFRARERAELPAKRRKMTTDLLNLAQRDPHAFDERDWRHAADLFAQLDRHAWLYERGIVPPNRVVRPAAISRHKVLRLHAELNRGLSLLYPLDDRAYWERRAWQPPVRAHRPTLVRQHRRLASSIEATWPDTVWLVVMSLLTEFGRQITRCPSCDERRLFLKTRRQAYCSAACSQRVRSARWYDKHRRASS